MKALEYIEKTQQYLDYVKEHILNVEKAWNVVKDKCADMRFIYDDFFYFILNEEVSLHDISKLSEQEFIQYRKAFYQIDEEKLKGRYDLGSAWENHKKENPHHWENWTKKKMSFPDEWEIHCAHMVIDWMAMGYKFNDTAKSYYEKNKEKIIIPDYAVNFIYEIFNRVYKN